MVQSQLYIAFRTASRIWPLYDGASLERTPQSYLNIRGGHLADSCLVNPITNIPVFPLLPQKAKFAQPLHAVPVIVHPLFRYETVPVHGVPHNLSQSGGPPLRQGLGSQRQAEVSPEVLFADVKTLQRWLRCHEKMRTAIYLIVSLQNAFEQRACRTRFCENLPVPLNMRQMITAFMLLE